MAFPANALGRFRLAVLNSIIRSVIFVQTIVVQS